MQKRKQHQTTQEQKTWYNSLYTRKKERAAVVCCDEPFVFSEGCGGALREVDCSTSSNSSLLKFCIPNPGMRLSFGQFAVRAWPSDFRLTSPDSFRRTIQWAVIFVINGIFWAWMLRFSLMDVRIKLIQLELFLYGLPGHFGVIGVQGQQAMHFSGLGNSVRNVLQKGGSNLLKLEPLAPHCPTFNSRRLNAFAALPPKCRVMWKRHEKLCQGSSNMDEHTFWSRSGQPDASWPETNLMVSDRSVVGCGCLWLVLVVGWIHIFLMVVAVAMCMKHVCNIQTRETVDTDTPSHDSGGCKD